MTTKQYTAARIVIVIALAILVSVSVIRGDSTLSMVGIAFAFAVLGLLFLRMQVRGVIQDERDYETGGTAARWALQVYAWIASVSMVALVAAQDRNPSYIVIAATLAYATCLLMILYVIFFRYHDQVKHLRKKWPYIAAGALLLLVLFVIGARLFSGEDDWICVDGQWVMHGHPSFPAPAVECRK